LERSDRADTTRPVGSLALLALGVNGIVGVGIFFAPAELARSAPGVGSLVVLAGTALALLPIALTFAVLGRRFDVDGGPVVFARAAFGEQVTFVVGWVAYLSAVVSAAATTAGFMSALLPELDLGGPVSSRVVTAGYVTALALACAAGIRVSAHTWSMLTVLKLLPLLALLAAYLAKGAPGAALTWPTEAAWLPAALTATFPLQGFEIVPVIAGQVRAPSRAVPFATVGSLAVAALLYLGLQAACVAALPQLASSATPLADAAAVYGGEALGAAVRVGTNVSALGISFGMMVTTPRYLAALAQGGALGHGLDRVDPRGVPTRALFVTWLAVSILVQTAARGQLFNLSATAVLMQFVSAAAALLVLAVKRARGLRPAHAGLAVPAGIVGVLIVVNGVSQDEALIAGCALAAGFVLRGVLQWSRHRTGA
jgi:amino acid transporter